MRLVMSGASGLIGGVLVEGLRADGHEVVRLVRRAARAADEAAWDPSRRALDPAVLAGADAVVNLSGAGVGDHRWTDAYKRTIIDSRVDTTATLAETLAAVDPRPRILLNASAVGWYGDTGDRVVTEADPAGEGFLADVSRRWEGATRPAEDAGVRVVRLRTGLVVSPTGGLLGQLLPVFRLGLGAPLGTGRQYMPLISLHDEVAAIRFLLDRDDVRGPVNLTGPAPVTNRDFTAILNRVLRRRTFPVKVPGFALHALRGEFADDVLAGQRAVPRVLTDAGFGFAHPDVESTLRWALGREVRST